MNTSIILLIQETADSLSTTASTQQKAEMMMQLAKDGLLFLGIALFLVIAFVGYHIIQRQKRKKKQHSKEDLAHYLEIKNRKRS